MAQAHLFQIWLLCDLKHSTQIVRRRNCQIFLVGTFYQQDKLVSNFKFTAGIQSYGSKIFCCHVL